MIVDSTVGAVSARVRSGYLSLSSGSIDIIVRKAVAAQLVRGATSLHLYWLESDGELWRGVVSESLVVSGESVIASGVTTFYARYMFGIGHAYAVVLSTGLEIRLPGRTYTTTWPATRLTTFEFDVSNDLQTISVLFMRPGSPVQAFVEVFNASLETVATPVISPAAGSYVDSVEVTITCTTPGSTIHYTVDGSAPTTASPVYTGAFTLTSTTDVRAMAEAVGFNNSDVASSVFTITATPTPVTATPVIVPASGTYVGSVTVSITSATPGAVIRYTTDGSVPGPASPVYSGSFTRTVNTTVRAYALAPGHLQSTVRSESYVIAPDTFTTTVALVRVYDFILGAKTLDPKLSSLL